MAVLAALGTAFNFAVSTTLVASQTSRIDPISMAAMRTAAGALFLIAALFVLGSYSEIGRMEAGHILQFIGTAALAMILGEPLFIGAVALLGVTRAFPMVMGLLSFFAYFLSVIFLGESIGWQVALGSVLVIAGISVVVLYGRAQPGSDGPAGGLPRLLRLGRAKRPPIAGATLDAEAALPAPRLARVRIPLVGLEVPRLALGLLLATGVALAWAGESVWLRGVSEGFEPAAVHGVRVPVVAVILLVIASVPRNTTLHRRALSRRSVILVGISGMISIGMAGILFVFALQRIGAGPASTIFATSPVFGLPLAAIFLRERLTVWMVVGTVVAVGGVALIA